MTTDKRKRIYQIRGNILLRLKNNVTLGLCELVKGIRQIVKRH